MTEYCCWCGDPDCGDFGVEDYHCRYTECQDLTGDTDFDDPKIVESGPIHLVIKDE